MLSHWIMQGIVSAIEDRNLKIGKASFQELTGSKKPILDEDNILHWPVVLLYAEVMTSDIIEDFCETDMFSAHLDMISSDIYVYYLSMDLFVWCFHGFGSWNVL